MKQLLLEENELLTKKRVLVVDDDLLMRELFKFKLSKQGFEVTSAKNEREFWQQAFDKKPDLILLDLWLNNKIGADIYDQLIHFGFDPEVPVIFITGHFQTASEQPIYVKKGQSFLSKPIDFGQLTAEIDRLMLTHNSDHALHLAERFWQSSKKSET